LKNRPQWNRLDNAAKIFPPTSNATDPKVFRCCCELYDDVEPSLLQEALDAATLRMPYFTSVMKKGFFWYYFEQSTLKPEVKEDYKDPCSVLYNQDRRSLLFEVTYYKNRINLEMFHALTDGTGALQFLESIVLRYLQKKHRLDYDMVLMDNELIESQLSQDSFSKFYSKVRIRGKKNPLAYQLRGERNPDYRYGVIQCIMPAGDMRKLAKRHDATLTELLTAYLIEAIHETMSVSHEDKPVVISVPVNLRNYFPSTSMRNFFGVILISHAYASQGKTFSDVLSNVKKQFKSQLKPGAIEARMNQLSSVEHNPAARLTPLILKSPTLSLANYTFSRSLTAGISNLGVIRIPAEFEAYIRLFSIFSSTSKLNICVCSYLDQMALTFTSSLLSPDVQRAFIRTLTKAGIEVAIDTNFSETINMRASP